MKIVFLSCCIALTTSGCAGDRLSFYNEGNANINSNNICIITKKGDILGYYLLSSSLNNHIMPLAEQDNIEKKHPDTCFPVKLQKNENYELIYIINDKKYRFEFMTDKSNQVIKTYSKV